MERDPPYAVPHAQPVGCGELGEPHRSRAVPGPDGLRTAQPILRGCPTPGVPVSLDGGLVGRGPPAVLRAQPVGCGELGEPHRSRAVPGHDGLRTAQPILRGWPTPGVAVSLDGGLVGRGPPAVLHAQPVGCGELGEPHRSRTVPGPDGLRIAQPILRGWPTPGVAVSLDGGLVGRGPPAVLRAQPVGCGELGEPHRSRTVPGHDGLRTAQPILRGWPASGVPVASDGGSVERGPPAVLHAQPVGCGELGEPHRIRAVPGPDGLRTAQPILRVAVSLYRCSGSGCSCRSWLGVVSKRWR